MGKHQCNGFSGHCTRVTIRCGAKEGYSCVTKAQTPARVNAESVLVG